MNKPKITAGELKQLKPGDAFIDIHGRTFVVRRNHTKPGDYITDKHITANPDYGDGPLTSIIVGPFYIDDIKRVLPKQRNAVRRDIAIANQQTIAYKLRLFSIAAAKAAAVIRVVIKDLIYGANLPRPKFEKGAIIADCTKDAEPYLTGPEEIVKPWLRRGKYRHVLEYINSAPDPDREFITSIKDRIRRPYGSFQLNVMEDPVKPGCALNDFADVFKYRNEIIANSKPLPPGYLWELYQQKND